MTSETDAKFVERISRAIYDSNSIHKDADLIRLFALARRGAEAADEIERLRAALRLAQRGLDPYATYETQLEARVVVDGICAALEERT